MRIVIDMQGAQTESRFRGIGRYTLSFAQAIVRNRGKHEILLALNGLFPDTIEPIRTAFDGLLPQENIRVWHAPGPVMEMQSGNESRRGVAELIREAFLVSLRPDIIHVSSLFEGYIDDAVTSIGCFDCSTPVSASLYDLIPLLNPDHYFAPTPHYEQYYLRKVEHLGKAALCLAISDFTRQEGLVHLKVPEDRIVNVSTAIEPRFRLLDIADDAVALLRQQFGLTQPFVLYTGGVDERKNLLRLIRAFADLPTSLRMGHQLLLVGKISSDQLSEIQELGQTCGLGPDELCFTGYVTDEELVQLYNLCALFVFPSWHEGFGLPALEAMACGAAVIGANTSSLPEVIGFEAALFDPFDVAAITAKMAEALGNEAFRTILRSHGVQQAKRFSWDESAKRAIVVWESLQKPHAECQLINQTTPRKPRLAFVSPLPPERTGIAGYSAELLPALSAHYDIEIIVSQNTVEDPRVKHHDKVRDVSWLRSHAGEIDRVIYQIGNSPFHEHMLSLVQEIPGTVVLHDFYLSGLMAWLELHAGVKHAWTRALYASHGYRAVCERYRDAEAAKQHYPANLNILTHAEGIIVHSEHSRTLARQCYGDSIADDWEVIPLLRSPVEKVDKETAREQLNIDANDFVVCCFGFLDFTKLNHRLLKCWLNSALAENTRCRLYFVGENHGGDYGASLLQTIRSSGHSERICITGYVSSEIFRQYLMAADMAVQLRTLSRGETSASALDCMNHALPLIVNAHGSMAELDPEAVWMIPDEFDDESLTSALEFLWRSPEKREALGTRARKIISDRHALKICAERYAQTIERFHAKSVTAMPGLLKAIANQPSFIPHKINLSQLATAIAETLPAPCGARRLFLDVSATCCHDLKTGIERVVRALLLALQEVAPVEYRIEPVYLKNIAGRWRHCAARRYMLSLLQCPVDALEDDVVDPECGDILLGLDLSDGALVPAANQGLFVDYRNRGVSVYAMVHDLLPVLMPDVFPPGAAENYEQWLSAISCFDGAICVSESVANDLVKWRKASGIEVKGRRFYNIAWVYHGADVVNSAPSMGLPENAEKILQSLQERPNILMVGTIEPRKGHEQVIEAFEQLWQEGVDANLVIVGKEGWTDLPTEMRRNIPRVVERLRAHPERNRHLFWLEGISDEYLEKVYQVSTCLLAASFGEGFGLPLIEAAWYGLPIMARDIPVFREVAGDQVSYFVARDGKDLAKFVREWLDGWQQKNSLDSKGIEFTSWKQCACNLLDFLIPGRGSAQIRIAPEDVRKRAMDEHLNLIHLARSKLVREFLPQGDKILDLGGANCPLYKMGYPHHFKQLYLIDLPPVERHEMYKEITIDSDCENGEVMIRYGDMTELEDFPDESVDLVWSGQSIEHVPYEKGMKMCQAAYRVLKRGGAFCLDTPNRLLTEIHTRDIGGGFIHPEHHFEYRPDQLRSMLERAGFEIEAVWGICEMKNTVVTNAFCYEDFLLGHALTKHVENSYIQYLHCRKP